MRHNDAQASAKWLAPDASPHPMALEVVWPRHKWDYLSVPDPDMPVDPPPLPSTWTDPERSESTSLEIRASNDAAPSRGHRKRRRDRRAGTGERCRVAVDPTVQQGRTLAAHAFPHGTQCGDRRVDELLGVSRRTVGRDCQQPPVTTALILERAQALIAASAARGSTLEERTAAEAWLTAGAPPAVPMSEERQKSSMHASLTLNQVNACGRLHRRIRVRTDVIRRLLEPDVERCEQIEVVLDLLIDIRMASEALETLLQDARPGHAPVA